MLARAQGAQRVSSEAAGAPGRRAGRQGSQSSVNSMVHSTAERHEETQSLRGGPSDRRREGRVQTEGKHLGEEHADGSRPRKFTQAEQVGDGYTYLLSQFPGVDPRTLRRSRRAGTRTLQELQFRGRLLGHSLVDPGGTPELRAAPRWQAPPAPPSETSEPAALAKTLTARAGEPSQCAR